MTAVTGRPVLPPAMEGIVEDVQLENTNYLTLNRVYAKIGQTELLAANPGAVHFGGFQLGQVYKQTLHIRNIHTASTRIHIIPPTTPFFKATCDHKKGNLAPGMADVIEVEFCPQEFRYYYDCVRIHSEGENLLVPLHAYPIMNETKFPKRIDFGRVMLGDCVTKRVKMECKVPIEFEYEINMVKPNAAFRVEPLRGVVPAHGAAAVSVTFEPPGLVTEECVLEVRVAEFGAAPVRCTVVGSVAPGLAKERALRAAVMPHEPLTAPGGGVLPRLTMEQLDGSSLVKTATRSFMTNKGGGAARGGAGCGDAFTVMLQEARRQEATQRDCRLTGPIRGLLPALPPPAAEVVVDGIYLPPSPLTTTADIAYVLNQEPGKLRIKDVKEAIRAKGAEQAASRAALGAIMAEGLHAGVHPLERPEVPAAIKAALFRQLLAGAEEASRRVALGSGVHVGEEVMGPEEIAAAQRLREDQHRAHTALTEAAAAARLEAVLEPAGALHLPAAQPGEEVTAGPLAGSAAFAAVAVAGQPGAPPAWRLIEANNLKARADVLLKFQRAVWRIISVRRLRRALVRIRDVLGQLGWDKQRLAEEAANPVLLVSEADRPGTAPTKHLKPDNVRTRPLPLYRDVNFTYHGPVPHSSYTDFDELGPMQFRVPLEYRVLGYGEEPFPGLTPYAPPLLEQPLEAGALEEGVGGDGAAPSGVVPLDEVAALPRLPDACRQAPFTTLEIGNRYSEDRVAALPEPSWGLDLGYLVQPAVTGFHDSTRQEVAASGSVRALRGGPALSARWLPRKDTWTMQLGEEVVPEPLAGPDPAHLLRDSPEDADKPSIQIRVPTDEEIARYLPPGLPNALQLPTAPPSSCGQTGAAQAIGDGAAPATAAPAGASADVQQQLFELQRSRRQTELDAAKRAAHEAAMKALLDDRISSYNSTLLLPCHFALDA